VNVRGELNLQHCVLPIGDFAYLGTFMHESGQIYSIKVIAKYKAAQRRMDMRLLDERIFLSALREFGNCVPKVVSTFQDSRVAMLIYEDVFCCDLAAVMSAGAIRDEQKPYYAACILAGITALHSNGLMHRYVTPEAVYLTTKGVPMVSTVSVSCYVIE
jgi:serine/threonine protein kinase